MRLAAQQLSSQQLGSQVTTLSKRRLTLQLSAQECAAASFRAELAAPELAVAWLVAPKYEIGHRSPYVQLHYVIAFIELFMISYTYCILDVLLPPKRP